MVWTREGLRASFSLLAIAVAGSLVVQGCGGGGHRSFGVGVPAVGFANLAIAEFTVPTPTVQSGTSFGYTYALNNSGNGPTGAVVYQVYVSNQQITSSNYTSGVLVGTSVNVGVIDGNTIEAGSVSVTVSSTNGLTPGAGFSALVVIAAGTTTGILVSQNVAVTIQ